MTTRQQLVDRMAATLHRAECDEKPGEDYPTWGGLAEWAKVSYRKRASRALRCVESTFTLQF